MLSQIMYGEATGNLTRRLLICWIVQPLEQVAFSRCSITADMDGKMVVLEQLARQRNSLTSGLGLFSGMGLTLALNMTSGFELTSGLGLDPGLWTSSLCF